MKSGDPEYWAFWTPDDDGLWNVKSVKRLTFRLGYEFGASFSSEIQRIVFAGTLPEGIAEVENYKKLLRNFVAKKDQEPEMLLQKSAGIGRAVLSSSVISRRFKRVLPDLPYDYGALEPVISAEIMRRHHQKHHATYVNNLNVAEEKCHEALQKGDVRAAITLRGALKFNGGCHINHSNLCKHGGNPAGSYPLFGVRNMCSGGNKDPGSVEVKIKRELDKTVKRIRTYFSSSFNRLIAALWLLLVLVFLDFYM
ncbi:iron/manganese superoxide dismutase, alpha-hairpin domain-containing protein [Ditylenchus destructor]|nr:iron/manganese superoxide dismutase, alpha-hairpin domain-containing protein [Ditylenchus destructor]